MYRASAHYINYELQEKIKRLRVNKSKSQRAIFRGLNRHATVCTTDLND